jgi:hypothetical protein
LTELINDTIEGMEIQVTDKKCNIDGTIIDLEPIGKCDPNHPFLDTDFLSSLKQAGQLTVKQRGLIMVILLNHKRALDLL